MTYFTYNGRSSSDFGLHIEKKNVFSAPEYDVEFISIPGRSGDIINPNRRFSNIKVTYTVFLARKIQPPLRLSCGTSRAGFIPSRTDTTKSPTPTMRSISATASSPAIWTLRSS